MNYSPEYFNVPTWTQALAVFIVVGFLALVIWYASKIKENGR